MNSRNHNAYLHLNASSPIKIGRRLSADFLWKRKFDVLANEMINRWTALRSECSLNQLWTDLVLSNILALFRRYSHHLKSSVGLSCPHRTTVRCAAAASLWTVFGRSAERRACSVAASRSWLNRSPPLPTSCCVFDFGACSPVWPTAAAAVRAPFVVRRFYLAVPRSRRERERERLVGCQVVDWHEIVSSVYDMRPINRSICIGKWNPMAIYESNDESTMESTLFGNHSKYGTMGN